MDDSRPLVIHGLSYEKATVIGLLFEWKGSKKVFIRLPYEKETVIKREGSKKGFTRLSYEKETVIFLVKGKDLRREQDLRRKLSHPAKGIDCL